MPEKSGIDAAPSDPLFAFPAAGAACWPKAGLATAANVSNESKIRCTFMSTSLYDFLGFAPPPPGADAINARLILYPKFRRCARLSQSPQRARRVRLVS